MRTRTPFWSLVLAALACNRTPPATDHATKEPGATAPASSGEHAGGHHETLPKRITVSEEVVKNAGIRVTAVTKAVLAEALTLPGEVAADPDRLARISSPAQGRIEEVRFREGAEVKKGDALVIVRVPEIAKARAAYLATHAKAKAARANAARLRSLLEQRLSSEQEVLNAETEAEALELEARSTADQLGALGAAASGAFSITLRSPIAGSVVARNAVVGQPTVADQMLGTVANLGEVWFLARVFEKDLGALKVGASADVHLNAYADQHFLGTVEYIGQQIDPVARTVTARVRLKNEQGLLRLGLFGTCQVSTGVASQADPRLVVSETSVTEIGDKPVVFVREKAGEFELHEVTLGREALGKVEILAGLREGEDVVSDGVFTLKSIVLKGSFGEDE
jgi:membrane fusion protein, heavy metal efflux system